jgi:hypothetical protein
MKFKLLVLNNGIALATHTPIVRAKSELAEYGYQFVDDNYDILIINFSLIPKDIHYNSFLKRVGDDSSPIIIFNEQVSAGKLNFWHLTQERVIGYTKLCLLKDMDLYKFKIPYYHYHLMSSIYKEPQELVSKNYWSESLSQKVHLGWNLGLYNFFTKFEPDFNIERPIDIHFSIGLAPFYESDQYYELHRNHFVSEVRKVVEKYKFTTSGQCGVVARKYPIQKSGEDKKYHFLMRHSKVCISPLGDGELCWRDFEAIIHGAILIKPEIPYIETWPDIYKPMETYIPVKWDLSDFEETIFKVINNYSEYKYITINAYQILKEALDNRVFAKRFDGTMKKILDGKEN